MALTATDVFLSKDTGDDGNGGTEEALLGAYTDGTTATLALTKAGALFTTLGITEGATRLKILAGSSATEGWYTVVDVVSNTELTLDRAPGNSVGNVDFNIGGPLLGEMNLADALADNDRVFVLNGVYAPGVSWDLSAFARIEIAGYLTTKEDFGAVPSISFLGTAVQGIKAATNLILVSIKIISPKDLPAIMTNADIVYLIDSEVVLNPTSVASAGEVDLIFLTNGSSLYIVRSTVSGFALPAGFYLVRGGPSEAIHAVASSFLCTGAGLYWVGVSTDLGELEGCLVDGGDYASTASGIEGNSGLIASGCIVRGVNGNGFYEVKTLNCNSYGNTYNYTDCVDLGGNLETDKFETEVVTEGKITLYRGDSPTLKLVIKDEDGNPLSLVGMTLTLGCRREIGSTSYFFSKADGTFDKTEAEDGIVYVDLTPTDLSDTVSSALLELQGTWGSKVRTLLQAYVDVSADVVHA
jgi:hypothetical protein